LVIDNETSKRLLISENGTDQERQMPSTAQANPHHGLLLADLTPDEAAALDKDVNASIAAHGRSTIELFIALGRSLAKLHAGRGYKVLSFPTWKAYLASKPDFGLTYLSYIMKVGEAAELGKLDLDQYRAEGLSGPMLLLYAQHTEFPAKIQDLMAATWSDVSGQPVKIAERTIRAHVEAHWADYRRGAQPPVVSHDVDWAAQWESDFRGLDATAQAAFIQTMWAFLEHHDSGHTPVHG
jgi:hypothetical protein